MIISRWMLLRMRNTKCGHVCYIQERFYTNLAVYAVMWRKCCKAGEATDDNITRHMRSARRVSKSRNTHSEYIVSTALPRNSGYTNAPEYCVRRALLMLLCHCCHLFGVIDTNFSVTLFIKFIFGWIFIFIILAVRQILKEFLTILCISFLWSLFTTTNYYL
jgi:hypothetical protein